MSWAVDAWGYSPWGGFAGSSALFCVEAFAAAENRILVEFSLPLNFQGFGAPGDASEPSAYTVVPGAGVPTDGVPGRSVGVIQANQGSQDATVVELVLDRPMSPWALHYTVTASGLVAADSTPLDPLESTASLLGIRGREDVPTIDQPVPSRDFAHPDSLRAQLDPLPSAGNQALLGGLPQDASGDYATDEGIVGYRKRMWRRLLAKPGGYAHLPSTYGLGLLQQVKKLARASERQRIAASAEAQILQEPETVKCRVTFQPGTKPGLWRMIILSRTTQWGAVRFEQNLIGF